MKQKPILACFLALSLSVAMGQTPDADAVEKLRVQLKQLQDDFERQQKSPSTDSGITDKKKKKRKNR